MAAFDLTFDLRSDPSASRLGREALLPLKSQVPAEAFSDLSLVVSELAANAVKYGPGTPIGVSVALADDGSIRGHVDDGGSGGVEMTEADPFKGTGLGLLVVDTIARAWGVDPGTSRVWFEIDPPSRTEGPDRVL